MYSDSPAGEMNRATKVVVAAGLAATTMSAAGRSAAAAPPPTEPPTFEGEAIPADFVTLTDDTGTINVGVPNSWTDLETAPRDGVPSVLAAPDLQV